MLGGNILIKLAKGCRVLDEGLPDTQLGAGLQRKTGLAVHLRALWSQVDRSEDKYLAAVPHLFFLFVD